jgi:hypothetical protein
VKEVAMLELTMPALTVIGAWFASYMGSYMRKKGENLATHEDLDKLVKQLEATTNATKAIEARISHETWGRQKNWEMKRDALVSVVQALERAADALMEMALVFANARKNGEESEAAWKETKWEKTQAWQQAMNSYDDKRALANLVCDRRTVDALRSASKAMRWNASKLFKGVISNYDEIGPEIQRLIVDAFAVARKELGVDAD